MKEQFVPFEIAKELKEIGYKRTCMSFYFDSGKLNSPPWSVDGTKYIIKSDKTIILAPLYQQVFYWFRTTHGLYAEILVDRTMEPKFCFQIYKYHQTEQGNWWEDVTQREEFFLEYTYEKAQDACIKRMLGIVKNKRYI